MGFSSSQITLTSREEGEGRRKPLWGKQFPPSSGSAGQIAAGELRWAGWEQGEQAQGHQSPPQVPGLKVMGHDVGPLAPLIVILQLPLEQQTLDLKKPVSSWEE